MSRYLIRTVAHDLPRLAWAGDLAAKVGGELVVDQDRDAYANWLRALEEQGFDGAWHLEDDAILTSDFKAKTQHAEERHPGVVIHGFSMRQKDVEVLGRGGQWRPGGSLRATVCVFLPAGMAPQLLAFAYGWKAREGITQPGWCDVVLSRFLQERKLRYWAEVPNLADHRGDAPSMISHTHRRGRVSRTFVP